MNISDNIRRLRRERALTQEALAEAMGVSCAAVSKWEKGQCAPDLSTLTSLADYFEVSVDALLDHRLEGDSLERQLKAAEAAADRLDAAQASAQCQRLLRFYPNEAEVAQRCAEVYYQLFVQTGEKSWMEDCIAQTNRLFLLKKGEPEPERLRRLRSLANQYELLDQWDKAKEFFEQANVNGMEDGNLARCLLGQGRAEEAVSMVSDAILEDILHLSVHVNTLAETWREMGKPETACLALEWLNAALEGVDYAPALRMIYYVQLSAMRDRCGDREKALAEFAKAEALVDAAEQVQQIRSKAPFLQSKKPWKLVMTTEKRKEFLETCRAALSGENPPKRSMTFALTKNLNKEE
ncbi:MAG: helix-turn-helix transcriptional regulator [Eubacteriales bacterium]|nr:helix-turn-helix transcriptional regulator [Eubacteriales bacterium]